MAIKRFAGKAGTLVVLEHESKVLKDNLLGDPHRRKLAVWLPPQYDAGETIEPSVSVPIATAQRLADTAAAEPELEPDGLRSMA